MCENRALVGHLGVNHALFGLGALPVVVQAPGGLLRRVRLDYPARGRRSIAQGGCLIPVGDGSLGPKDVLAGIHLRIGHREFSVLAHLVVVETTRGFAGVVGVYNTPGCRRGRSKGRDLIAVGGGFFIREYRTLVRDLRIFHGVLDLGVLLVVVQAARGLV